MSDKKRKGLISESRKMKCSFRETSCIDTSWTALKPHRLKQAIAETFAHTSRKRVARLTGDIVAATLLGVTPSVSGQELDLYTLNGSNGFTLKGEMVRDYAGGAVTGAGDINGDGLADIIVGASGANHDNGSGTSYVVFGSNQVFTNPLDPAVLDGTNGFRINGEASTIFFGFSVSAAGDMNGDGIDDIIMGSLPGHPVDIGAAYVIFGSTQPFNSEFLLSSLDGLNGIKINAEHENDGAARAVSGIGDFNGDGIDDIIIGAGSADSSNGNGSGASYVVFGRNGGFNTPFELSSIDGNNGFKINGEAAYDGSGNSVSGAGDINGDGLADVIIGAAWAAPNGEYSGASYVVFGSDTIQSVPLELSSLDGSNGFKINGESHNTYSGYAVSEAGDINGDGLDDLIIGAPNASPGAVYVVFGNRQNVGSPLELASLDGNNGFKINGEPRGGAVGGSVAGANDVNGDGFDDIIIGTYHGDGSNPDAIYVVFGHDRGFSTPLDLANLKGGGFRINSDRVDDRLGDVVSMVDDFNGDGIDDFIMGAPHSWINGSRSGAAYVVFGSPTIGQSRPPHLLACPGDIDGNGTQDILVLTRNNISGIWTSTIRDAVSANLVSQIEFDNALVPVDIEVIADINTNGAPELVILDNNSVNAEVRDSLSGELLGVSDFDSDPSAHDIEWASDQDGNGIPEIAHLSDGLREVEIIDPLTAYGSSPVDFFNPFLIPKDLSVFSHNTTKLAVLAEHNKADQPDKIQIRNLSNGSLVRNLFLGKNWQSKQMEILADTNGNDSPEAAVLRLRLEDDLISVLIKDTKTGNTLNYLGFDAEFPPIKMTVVPSFADSAADEIAILGRRADGGRQKVQIKDAQSSELLKQVFFNSVFAAQDMVVCPDMNSNGVSELVVLGKRSSDGKVRVFVNDAQSGESISKVNF